MSFGNHLFLLLKARQLLTYLCIPYIYMGYLHISMYLFCLFVFLFFSLRYGFLFYWPSLCMCRCLDVLKFAWGPVHVGGWHWEICLNGHELDFIVSCVNCISFVCYIWKKKKKDLDQKKRKYWEEFKRISRSSFRCFLSFCCSCNCWKKTFLSHFSLDICRKMLQMIYQSVVASVFYAVGNLQGLLCLQRRPKKILVQKIGVLNKK